MEYEQFFDELASRLKTTKDLDREFDRRLAHRFNVFDYLQDDELGLSRIIADLLDPEGKHGQGTLFLQTLLSLEGPKNRREWPRLDGSHISVVVKRELRIPSGRQIDISIRIDGDDGETYCLAIENKPYADDQVNQVRDYLYFLREKFRERFLLIYISPTGQAPSQGSVSKRELKESKDHFAIMPYDGGQEEPADKFYDDFRIPHSVADWLKECQKNCEVDRLRWFLRDAETFCRRRFGGQAMITDREREAAVKFVLSNPSNLKTALAVYGSWPDVVDRVCKGFLEELCSRIKSSVKKNETLKQFAGDICVDSEYVVKAWKTKVWLYRKCWSRYPVRSDHHGRTIIGLMNERLGPDGMGFFVGSPMMRGEMEGEFKNRRKRLDTRLVSALACGKDTDHCPWWWNGLDQDKKNWSSLIPILYHEKNNQDGEIMRYFVGQFVKIAEIAIPIINEIEGPKCDN